MNIDAIDMTKVRAQVREQAVAFEGLFLGILFRTMRDSVPQNERFHGGRGEKVFGGLMDNELAVRMADRGGFGIADMIENAVLPKRGTHEFIA